METDALIPIFARLHAMVFSVLEDPKRSARDVRLRSQFSLSDAVFYPSLLHPFVNDVVGEEYQQAPPAAFSGKLRQGCGPQKARFLFCGP